MIEQTGSVSEHAATMMRNAGHWILNAAPFILMVFAGYTAQSINHHYKHWCWTTYFVGCANVVILGLVVCNVTNALGINHGIGTVLAVLVGRNTSKSLDMFSEDVVAWIRRKLNPQSKGE